MVGTGLRAWAMLFVLALLGGCVISVNDHGDREDGKGWREAQERNRAAIAEMRLGRTRDSVVAELGTADFTESFVRDGRTFYVLRYRTHHAHEDGRTTKDETTPLVFVDDELVGWGESALDNALP